jgi:DNA-binding protein YbaB
MSAPIDSSGLDRLIGQTLKALGQARGGGVKPDDTTETTESEPVQGSGEGADGLIRATAVAGGRLTDLHLDPRVLRMTTVSLSEGIVTAVNAAFEDLQNKIRESAVGPDLDALATQLKEVQEESTRQMGSFLQALTDAQERIAAAGRP